MGPVESGSAYIAKQDVLFKRLIDVSPGPACGRGEKMVMTIMKWGFTDLCSVVGGQRGGRRSRRSMELPWIAAAVLHGASEPKAVRLL